MEKSTSFDMQKVLQRKVSQAGGFVNAHSHLDRFGTINEDLMEMAEISTVQQKWGLVKDLKINSSSCDYQSRISRGVEHLLTQGVTSIGTFIDIDPDAQDKAIKAALKVKDFYKGQADIILMNQTLSGVLEREAYEWFRRGAELVDIVGGLPAKDEGREAEHLDVVLQTAKSMGKMVHVHVDQCDNPAEKESELLIQKTREHGMRGKVVAIHAISIASQAKEYRQSIYQDLRREGIIVVACPTAWLDRKRNETLAPIHNSITPFDEMREFGIPVAVGTDNIADLYCPWNMGDIMREMTTLAVGSRVNCFESLVQVATKNGRMALGLEPKVAIQSNGYHKNGTVDQMVTFARAS